MTLRINASYNIAGAFIPIIVAFLTVPLFLRQIGEAKFGILALVWLVIGYFGTFDLGLSRATVSALAKAESGDAASKIFWSALVANVVLGSAVGTAAYVCFTWGLLPFINDSPAHLELAFAAPWMAVSIPVSMFVGVFNGVLIAQERFLTLNALSVFGSALAQILPLLAAYYVSIDLSTLIAASVLARVATAFAFGIVAARVISARAPEIGVHVLHGLLSYGGWIMVSNMVAPVLIYVDQFVIGAILGGAAVAYYNVSFNLVTKAHILSASLVQALFPRLVKLDDYESRVLAEHSSRAVSVLMAAVCVYGLLLAKPFLVVWLGSEFASHAAPAAEILMFGVWVSSLAFIPLAWLQAQQRPDLVAKLHLLEVLPYLVVLCLAIYWLGLLGAAIAWTLRATADAFFLFRAVGSQVLGWRTVAPAAAMLLAAIGLVWSYSLSTSARMAIGLVLVSIGTGWTFCTDSRAREWFLVEAKRFYIVLSMINALRTARTRPSPLKYLLGRVLVKSGLARHLRINRSSYRLRLSPTNLAFTLWELGSSAWREDEDVVLSVLRPGDTHVDVGANIGALALAAKGKVGTEGRVIAIEAHPATFAYLRQNVKDMGHHVETYNVAVGDSNGRIGFTDTISDDMNSVAIGSEGGFTVNVVTLDDLLAATPQVRLLKVDVEGFELRVFMGARKILARTDVVYFESFDRHSARYGYAAGDLIAFLNSAGFSVFRPNGQECLPQNHSSPRCENLIAISEQCGDRCSIMSSVEAAHGSRPRHPLLP